MTAVLQTTIWNAFSWMKCFTEICSQGSNWQFCSIGYNRDAITWTIADPAHRHICTALGGDELRCLMWKYTLALKYVFHQIQFYSFKQNGLKFCLHRSHKTINLQTHKLNTYWFMDRLTHWGRMTHICVGKLTTIGSDNGLSPGRRQAIIWTNAGIFLIEPLETNLSEILIKIQTISFKKMHLKMSSAEWRPFISASMS